MDRLLPAALGASIVSTGIHYTDNFIEFEKYPQPDWIEQALVFLVQT